LVISSASADHFASMPTNRPAERATVFSTTHRYAISGCPAFQGVQIGTWAEDVESRLVKFLGVSIPPGEPLPIAIRVGDDPAVGRGRVIRSQGYDSGLLDQRLDMINPRTADQEDLLEGLCSLLLSRAMVAHLPQAARKGEPPRAPDWIAVGAAQNLFAEGRQRNTRTVMTAWKNGGGSAIEKITGWEFMPDGRWDDKADAGLFMEFLMPPSVAPKRSAALLARIENGDAITAELLARQILFCGTVANAEKMRDIWLAQKQDIQTDFGGISPDRVAALVRMLEIRPSDYGIPDSAKIPLLADMKDLARRHDEKWVQDLAARMSMKMQTLALGQSTDFQRVIAAYVGYLDALSGTTRGVFGTRAAESTLRKLLDQAETQFITLQASQKQQKDYLQKTDEQQRTPAPDAIGSYLDRLEKQSAP
jgi:hypothetical protein